MGEYYTLLGRQSRGEKSFLLLVLSCEKSRCRGWPRQRQPTIILRRSGKAQGSIYVCPDSGSRSLEHGALAAQKSVGAKPSWLATNQSASLR